jgi:FOG: HEAT repeat
VDFCKGSFSNLERTKSFLISRKPKRKIFNHHLLLYCGVWKLVDQEKIHNQCLSDDPKERIHALEELNSFFSFIPDKQQAWNELIKLTNDEDHFVRSSAAFALDSAFSQVPDKQQVWNDLHRLANDEKSVVRYGAAKALSSAFSQVPDKQKAWNDLHRLTSDENFSVRSRAAEALGSAFSYMPDKQQAWNDLHRLTNDKNNFVRTSSNHSLGRVSIFMASQAETEANYKNELEKAIGFFETAAKESSYFNPAQFCLPFYRSFHTIIFKKQEAKEEIYNYLEEAKAAIKGSKSKEILIEAVENLAEALKEVQTMENLDLSRMKDELNFYRKYCDHAAELIVDTEKTAPFATIAMRKGLLILDRNLKELLEEIQEKARRACRDSIGTDTEEIARDINREVQKWEIGSQEDMTWYVENLIFTLESTVPKAQENQLIFDKIKQIRKEKVLVRQYAILCSIIPMIPTIHVKQAIAGLENEVHQINEKVDTLTISFKPSIKQEIEISLGFDISGNGAKVITTIPLQEISYEDLKEDLQLIKGKHINKLYELPKRLANKIKDYLSLKDRVDIIKQLT